VAASAACLVPPPRAYIPFPDSSSFAFVKLSELCLRSPSIDSVRSALRVHKSTRLDAALSALAAEVRVACAAAFTLARATPASLADLAEADRTARMADQSVADVRALVADCAPAISKLTQRFPGRDARVLKALSDVVGNKKQPVVDKHLAPCGPVCGPVVQFEHGVHLCLAAVACGWDPALARAVWSSLGDGQYSALGRLFTPSSGCARTIPGLAQEASSAMVLRAEEAGPVTVTFAAGQVVSVFASTRLQAPPRAPRPATGGGLASLPSFIALPRDPEGRPIIPRTMVTTLVEHQDAWHTQLGSIDAATSAIVKGLLIMPKVAVPSQQRTFSNHPSWENDPAAREALGPVIAKWLAQGVLEYVEWDDRQPVLLQPCGAVPKGSAPFYRLITDARFGNRMYSDWGVSYTSAAELSHVLHQCDFTWCSDLEDAYHLAVFSGCGGALRPVKRPVVSGSGEVSWIDGFVNGCDPSSCLGGCDKDMSGLSIEGHVFRFAACQFGQKTAGSPLNSLVMSVARYFARLPQPVHVAAWVDDLHFSLSTPPHPLCEGHRGGCPTCVTYYGHALRAQALWHAKAAALGLPLSPTKGHEVDQGGPFCGINVDCLHGWYLMLPEKIASCGKSLDALLEAPHSSPRLLAQGRGKAGHYACAVSFLALGCASLSQAMHQKEALAAGPTPSFREERQLVFDWDAQVPVSTRCRAALAFMRRALAERGAAGRPLWPVPSTTMLGAFYAGRSLAVRILVISLDVDLLGWRMAARLAPGQPALRVSRSWADTLPWCHSSWMAPLPASGDPDLLVALHSFAASAALSAAQDAGLVQGRALLFRSPCTESLHGLRCGDFKRPAAQDGALLFGAACLDLGLDPPFFVPRPATPGTPAAEPAQHSPDLQWDTSSTDLRELLVKLAAGVGASITLDVFASSHSTLADRYFATDPDPRAEGLDAFAQPDWGSSLCPVCHSRHQEFIALTPPHSAVAQALRKAQWDEAAGVLVVPHQVTAPWWPLAMGASRTPSPPGARVFAPCQRLRARRALHHPSGAYLREVAICVFDFRPDSCRAPHTTCPGSRAWRGTSFVTASDDLDDDLAFAHLA
jgi:hypothetical protein